MDKESRQELSALYDDMVKCYEDFNQAFADKDEERGKQAMLQMYYMMPAMQSAVALLLNLIEEDEDED